jgi:16S rRNA (guanine966-N2)-methyltransferase
MTDKVRGALFDILGTIVTDAAVLDAYAGTGALGFEALSRGAQRVVAVELGHKAAQSIRENVALLEVGFQYQLEEARVESWLARTSTTRFDLIFAMPPYALFDNELIARIGALLNPDGVMVVEYTRQQEPAELDGLELVEFRRYGDPALAFYSRK